MKALILIILLACTAFAAPMYYTGMAVTPGQTAHELRYSTQTSLGSNLTNLASGGLKPVPKTINNRRPVVSAQSSFNPNRNVMHSNATVQTWDYRGYCIEQEKSVQLRATKLSCSYQRQDRQWNTWSCAAGDYLRCVGTGCPANTCRVPGVRVS